MNKFVTMGLILVIMAPVSTFGAVGTYEDATRLLGKERVQSDINLSGQTKTDGEIVRYLQTRNCNRSLKPYYVTKMNVDFRRRLYALMKSADRVGYYMYIYSGARTPSDQRRIQRTSKNGSNRKWVGSVYGSKHVKGIAADIKVGSCGGKHPKHGDWLHRNARKYKLYFRMSWEPWHIEPVEGEKIKNKSARSSSVRAVANTQVSQPYQTPQAEQYRQLYTVPTQQDTYYNDYSVADTESVPAYPIQRYIYYYVVQARPQTSAFIIPKKEEDEQEIKKVTYTVVMVPKQKKEQTILQKFLRI